MRRCAGSCIWHKTENCFVLTVAESHVGKSQVVRLDLQQQVVYGHVDHSVSQQERFVRRKDQKVTAHRLLPGIYRHAILSYIVFIHCSDLAVVAY